MESAESIGYVQYWGFSKWINLLKNNTPQNSQTQNILISAAGDLRHVIKTCLDNSDKKDVNFVFYVHEKQKEPLCRDLLLLLIMHTTNLTFRERSELFLDIYGNSLIREKSQKYIDLVIPYLDNLISGEKKFTSALNKIIDLKEIKFKERDEFVEIIRSWYSNIPFEMAKLRDQRLRHHYSTRYDYRANLIDWDYQMNTKENTPIIHFYHYKEWRQSGVAFESRFSTYPTPNRTLSSYLPGKKKLTRESCMVRGYWGDITVSPYISYGISTDIMPEKENLFKVRNMAQVSHSVEVSEFNVKHFIQKFDTLNDYHLEIQQPPKKDENLEKIDEKNENEENEEQKEPEEKKDNKTIKQDFEKERSETELFISQEPLLVFQNLNLKIVPICEDLEKLSSRQKYKGFFDAGFVGLFQSGIIKQEYLKQLFKKNSSVYFETPKHLVTLKKEDKTATYQALINAGQQIGWEVVNDQNDEFILFNLK